MLDAVYVVALLLQPVPEIADKDIAVSIIDDQCYVENFSDADMALYRLDNDIRYCRGNEFLTRQNEPGRHWQVHRVRADQHLIENSEAIQ